MNKPTKCCDFGEFKCDVPMAIKGKVEYVDFCIAKYIAALNAANIITVNSCCGHGKIDGSIILDNGYEIIIRKFDSANHVKEQATYNINISAIDSKSLAETLKKNPEAIIGAITDKMEQTK